jgi:hypothetical protein
MIQAASVAKHNAEAQGNVHALFMCLYICSYVIMHDTGSLGG